MSRAIDAAVIAQLEAATNLLVFAGGEVVGQPNRYCVVWSSSGARYADRMDGSQGNVRKTYTIHSVGSTVEQAGWVNDRVMAQLIDFKPVVAGWSFQRLKHEVSRPVQIDRDVSPHLAYFVDQFDLYAFPNSEES